MLHAHNQLGNNTNDVDLLVLPLKFESYFELYRAPDSMQVLDSESLALKLHPSHERRHVQIPLFIVRGCRQRTYTRLPHGLLGNGRGANAITKV